jgi:5-deoxy-glucuronate isomerase
MIKVVRGDINHKWNPYVTREKNPEMMSSEFGVIFLKKGESYELKTEEEYIFCLNLGSVIFRWDGIEEKAVRNNCFIEDPYVLHVHSGTEVSILCTSESAEINVANTDNDKAFANRLYRPEDLMYSGVVDEEKLDGKVKRRKRVFFDRSVCPETNLFCGEVVSYPGCWACYPPHLHTEPEIYYYKFFPSKGYGFAEFGDEAIKIVDRSVTCNPGGQLHSQVTAPGYAEYIMWTQRLQDNGKDIEYTLDEQHAWLDAENVRFFPEITE